MNGRSWSAEGGGRELLRLAVPLILSNSFMTLQITMDRVLLGHAGSDAIAASMPAALLYWTVLTLFQNTANYATTFVAQYVGAERPGRAGPAVWQALYFAVATGLLFLSLRPLAPQLFALGGHSPAVQEQEVAYFRALCFAALPALVVASVNSFFAGRGKSWTVLLIDGVGMTINPFLAYAWIFGRWGMPACGIAGAGWATAVSACVSAVLGLVLFLRPRFREAFGTLDCRFDRELFGRLMRFGLPNGVQWMLDAVAFTVFLFLVGRLGDEALAATNIAFTVNMAAIIPMLGVAQAVGILVGQRLGQDRPAVAERTTWTGLWVAGAYMGSVAVLYLVAPEVFVSFFRGADAKAEAVARLVPVLLRFVALYCVFDSMTLVFSFALRGAGDTRFVTVVSLAFSWPLMVLPTWAAWHFGWGLYWAWTFASSYIMVAGFIYLLRFRAGKWRTMRVIEAATEDPCRLPVVSCQ